MSVGIIEQVVLLPGNHDQLSYEEGRDLLQPLEKAASRSPLVLALRRPTLINKELLFLPHIREASKLQRIMARARQVRDNISLHPASSRATAKRHLRHLRC